jgi:hypothetical protein
MNSVGVSSFIKNQVMLGGKTEIVNISLNQIAGIAEKKLNEKEFEKGYRDGVIIIKITDPEYCKKFICPIVKINKNTKFQTKLTRRRPGEEDYIQIKALNGDRLKTSLVELILYRRDVLKETNEISTNSDWELIAFHAIPDEIEKLPMKPVTMMRNQRQLPGGTKAHYSSEEWSDSIHFWQKYALIDS